MTISIVSGADFDNLRQYLKRKSVDGKFLFRYYDLTNSIID
jgi:hypothetical protein